MTRIRSLGRAAVIAAFVALALAAASLPAVAEPLGDFTLAINPTSQKLNPNSSTSYQVVVDPVNGFAQNVALAVGALPSGVTGSFSPVSVVPGHSSFLTLTAGPTITPGPSPITVTGTSGDLIHRAGATLDLEFGLIPVCHGTFTGKVTDRDTGAPISGASIVARLNFSVAVAGTTGDDGRFRIEKVPVGEGNAPGFYSVDLSAPGYLPAQEPETAACGFVTSFDTTLLKRGVGAIAGHVVEGIPDPNDHSSNRSVTPTDTPIAGAFINSVDHAGTQHTATSGDDGSYRLDDLALGDDNAPVEYFPFAQHSLYWPAQPRVSISAGTTSKLEIPLVKICTGSITITVVDDTSRQPVPGATVSLATGLGGSGFPDFVTGTADQDGIMTLEGVPLGNNNSSRNWFIVAFGPAGSAIQPGPGVQVPLTTCGSHGTTEATVHRPILRKGAVAGTVKDADTGAAVPQVNISLGSFAALTDADGAFSISDIAVGQDDQKQATFFYRATADGYWTETGQVVVNDGETTQLPIVLTRKKLGVVTGTLTDSVTATPLAGMQVFTYQTASTVTDSNGHYRLEGDFLGPRNTPSDVGVVVPDANGYWGETKVAQVAADVPAAVDFALLRECSTATINGRVFNATTKEPLPDATVSSGDKVVMTDAAGRFALTSLRLFQNKPRDQFVQVSKVGFVTAFKTVSIFCGAVVELDFGRTPGATGTITGHVRDARDLTPVGGAFVGSAFGASTTTSPDGSYTLTNVPLGDGDAPQSWSVSVTAPDGSPLRPGTKSVLVSASPPAVLDFDLDASPPPPPQADLSVTLTDNGPFDPGSTGAWTVHVTNAGPDPAIGPVVVVVTLPSGTALRSVSGAGWTCDPGVPVPHAFTCTRAAPLAVGDGPSLFASVDVADSAPPVLTATATVAASTTDPNNDNNHNQDDVDVRRPTLEADVSVLVHHAGNFTVGTSGSFSINATNNGPDPAAAVTVTDVLPPSLAFVSATGDGWSCSFQAPNVVCTTATPAPVGDLPPIALTVLPSAAGDVVDHAAVATATDDPDLTNNSAIDSTHVNAPINRPPVARISVVDHASEGTVVTADGTSSSDPEGGQLSYGWDLDGDGVFAEGSDAAVAISSFRPGPRTIALRVTDDHGATDTARAVVTFLNVPPEVTDPPATTLDQPGHFATTAGFTDPGADTWTATADYGDGTGGQPAPVTGSAHSVSLDHDYSSPGHYVVSLQVCDDLGACGTGGTTVEVHTPSRTPPPTTTTTTVPTSGTTTTTTVPTTTTTTTTTTLPTPTTTTGTTTTTTTTLVGEPTPIDSASTTSTTVVSPRTTATTRPSPVVTSPPSTTVPPPSGEALGAAGPPAATNPSPGPTAARALVLDRPTAEPGGKVAATGEGCRPGEEVVISVADREAARVHADADGRFEASLSLPNVEPGRYDVTATCGTVLLAAIDLVVAGQADPETSTLLILLFFLLIGLFLVVRPSSRSVSS